MILHLAMEHRLILNCMHKPIKIFIVDDHKLITEGICSLLKNEQDIIICGYALTALSCMEWLLSNSTDIILMDISLPDINGINLCQQVKTKYPRIQVIALSTMNQGSYITSMMGNGASGYLLKNAERHEIIEAIHTVQQGKTYFSFEAGKTYNATVENKTPARLLTKREKDILKLVAGGFTNNEIAAKLFISIDTVDTHRKNLYTKLEVRNTAQLIRAAIDNNLLA